MLLGNPVAIGNRTRIHGIGIHARWPTRRHRSRVEVTPSSASCCLARLLMASPDTSRTAETSSSSSISRVRLLERLEKLESTIKNERVAAVSVELEARRLKAMKGAKDRHDYRRNEGRNLQKSSSKRNQDPGYVTTYLTRKSLGHTGFDEDEFENRSFLFLRHRDTLVVLLTLHAILIELEKGHIKARNTRRLTIEGGEAT